MIVNVKIFVSNIYIYITANVNALIDHGYPLNLYAGSS
jgi:hypothetical protein